MNPSTCLSTIYVCSEQQNVTSKLKFILKFSALYKFLYNETIQTQKCNIEILLFLKYLGFLQVNTME